MTSAGYATPVAATHGWEGPRTSVVPSGGGEDDLLARLRAGDDDAFAVLVRSHSGRLLAAARRLLRNDEDAADAVQEAFLSAFRSIDRFSGAARLSTWLHRIVINAALMKLRSGSRRPETSIDDLLPRFDADGHFIDEVHGWSESTDDLLERREARLAVQRCIGQLPESYRTVLMLRDIEDLDTEEVAEMLSITANAAKIRLHRARQALRTLLERTLGTGNAARSH